MGERLNGLALFAGVGGLELGLKIALGESYQCVCYVEREAFAAATLVERMGDEALDRAPIWDDVSTFKGKPWRRRVDLISGGFPCQDISVAGKREGIKEGNRSGLWFHFARIIREVRPRYVFVENVGALLVPRRVSLPIEGPDGIQIFVDEEGNLSSSEIGIAALGYAGTLPGAILRVLGDLSEMGFDAEWGSVRASEVTAPHRRERIFIMAKNSASIGRRGRRDGDSERSGRKIQIAGLRGGLADATCRGARPSEFAGQLRGSQQKDEELADAENSDGRRPRGENDSGRRDQKAGGSSGILADAGKPRREGSEIRSPFPPGPGDREAWERILTDFPELAPAVANPDTSGPHGRKERDGKQAKGQQAPRGKGKLSRPRLPNLECFLIGLIGGSFRLK